LIDGSDPMVRMSSGRHNLGRCSLVRCSSGRRKGEHQAIQTTQIPKAENEEDNFISKALRIRDPGKVFSGLGEQDDCSLTTKTYN